MAKDGVGVKPQERHREAADSTRGLERDHDPRHGHLLGHLALREKGQSRALPSPRSPEAPPEGSVSHPGATVLKGLCVNGRCHRMSPDTLLGVWAAAWPRSCRDPAGRPQPPPT